MINNILRKFAKDFGLSYNKNSSRVYGNFKGYNMVIIEGDDDYSVKVNFIMEDVKTQEDISSFINDFIKENDYIINAFCDFNDISITIRKIKNKENSILDMIVCQITNYLYTNGYKGSEQYAIKGKVIGIRNNLAMGIVGAVLGAVIGIPIWIFCYNNGYIVGIGSIVMTLFSILGFSFFGDDNLVRGVIICIIATSLMIFLAENISVYLKIEEQLRDFGAGSIGFMKSVNMAWKSSMMRKEILTDLGFGYLFTLIFSLTIIGKKIRTSEVP